MRMPAKKNDKEKLDTVPSTEDILAEEAERTVASQSPIKPITFMGLDEDETIISSNTISELPIQLSAINNYHIMKNCNYFMNTIDSGDMVRLHQNQRRIHVREIYNMIMQQVNNIILNFTECSKMVSILSGDGSSYQDNMKYQIMSSLDAKLDKHYDVYDCIMNSSCCNAAPSAYRGTTKTNELKEDELERTVVTSEAFTSQIIQILVTSVCSIVESCLRYTIQMMDDETCKKKINEACKDLDISLNNKEYDIANRFPKMALMSFMSTHMKNELADVTSQIEETVDGIMEGFAKSNYYIFDDLKNFKDSMIETDE